MGDESPHEADAPLSSSRVYSHGEKCPGSLCSYISSAFFKMRWTDEVQPLFHDPCDTCSSFSEREPLCSFCSHLRLRHLLVCLCDEPIGLKIHIGDYHKDRGIEVSRVMETNGCAFCELVDKVIESYFEISSQNVEVRQVQTGIMNFIQNDKRRGFSFLVRVPESIEVLKINGLFALPSTLSISSPSKSIIQSLVNWDQIQGWLSHCNQEHNCKTSQHSAVSEGFRLINVEDRCVTSRFGQHAKPGVDIKFVALSYVWGESNVSRHNALLSSNKSEFEAVGGLKEGKVPRAIEDAITICKRLKQRYLWVDRFCIIQNDEDGGEKQRQINAMGDIYSSAEFTIIHASGESIHCPIPGVSKERKVLQSLSVIAGVEFTISHPNFKYLLETSKWNTRGWTYQEAMLSPRKLVFTSFEVWFECNDRDDPFRREDQYSTRTENQADSFETTMTQFRMNPFYLPEATLYGFTNFARHLKSYTARSLTNQSDILNAFTGILKSVCEGKRSFHGLPEDDFDQALLWYCYSNNRPTRWGEDCPSWSWTSVSEGVAAPVSDPISGFIGTLVWWVYRGPDGGLTNVTPCNSLRPRQLPTSRIYDPRLLSSMKQWHELPPDYSPQIHLLFAWWQGCIEAPVPKNLEQRLAGYSKERHESGIAGRWPTLEKVWDDIRSARNARPEAPMDLCFGLRKEDRPLLDKLPSRALLTRAQTARFRVSCGRNDLSFYTNPYRCQYIVDSNGERVGMIEGQDLSVTEPMLTESKPSQGPYEFMAISLSQNHPKRGRRRMFPVCYGNYRLYYMHNRLFPSPRGAIYRDEQPVVNVLLIGRTEESWLVHRISIGWIYLVDWCRAKREFKTIALE